MDITCETLVNIDNLFDRIIVTGGIYTRKAEKFTNETIYNYKTEYVDKTGTKFTFFHYFNKSGKFIRSLKYINDKLMKNPYFEFNILYH